MIEISDNTDAKMRNLLNPFTAFLLLYYSPGKGKKFFKNKFHENLDFLKLLAKEYL
jgi:hypothetical protein